MEQSINPYVPELATVIKVIDETPNIKTFQVIFDYPEKMKSFSFEPGQVGQLSIFGVGESTFVINSPPTRMDYLQFSVMKAGEVTAAIHDLHEGDKIDAKALKALVRAAVTLNTSKARRGSRPGRSYGAVGGQEARIRHPTTPTS